MLLDWHATSHIKQVRNWKYWYRITATLELNLSHVNVYIYEFCIIYEADYNNLTL